MKNLTLESPYPRHAIMSIRFNKTDRLHLHPMPEIQHHLKKLIFALTLVCCVIANESITRKAADTRCTDCFQI